MLIRCIRDNINDVIDCSDLYKELKNTVNIPGDKLHISIGQTYVVYAIHMEGIYPTLFIADDVFIYYPNKYDLRFFEVIDERFSKYWLLPKEDLKWSEVKGNFSNIFLSFEEWSIKNECFYERLVDEEKNAFRMFKKYKELMDLEFSIPSVKEIATILLDKWVQCPLCDESWEVKISGNEMLKCPNCSILLQNPLPRQL